MGYRFKNPNLLFTALTHSSYAETPQSSNERMEFLGDAFLGLVISETLYRRFPDYLEGALSIVKGTVVSRRSCTRIARTLGLGDFLFLGRGIDRVPDSFLANVVESVIAAIYLDGGASAAEQFIERVFADEIDAASGGEDEGNFKSMLQRELHHRQPSAAVIYQLLDEKGPDHYKCFKIQVQINGEPFRAAWANNKKQAEQKAAENALCELRGETPPWPDGD